jgi:hypothetical protein
VAELGRLHFIGNEEVHLKHVSRGFESRSLRQFYPRLAQRKLYVSIQHIIYIFEVAIWNMGRPPISKVVMNEIFRALSI